MSHSEMADSDGKFQEPEMKRYMCRKCKQITAKCRTWESSCGGYEDYKYECGSPDCKHSWWIEGIDS